MGNHAGSSVLAAKSRFQFRRGREVVAARLPDLREDGDLLYPGQGGVGGVDAGLNRLQHNRIRRQFGDGGCAFLSGSALIHALAAGTNSSTLETNSSTTPTDSATDGFIRDSAERRGLSAVGIA
ncbi:hypothetical protein [Nocardia nepalensis]|uniref:hypothetical protein n=1 Tax=Nocardia nepalensis TaxID=3375448 RepID=UPI003B67AB97